MSVLFIAVLEKLIMLLSFFVYIYPLAMSVVWTLGAIFFCRVHEKKEFNLTIRKENYPPISILVPCHNEENTIELTCKNLKSLDYLDYHVIFINDASTDNTLEVLRKYTEDITFFHIINLQDNQGKAGALNTALSKINTPFVLILDADTIIQEDALKWFIQPFFTKNSLAAVTGNPMPLNRSNFLSKFQTAEFMSIIGLIKRCQCFLGKIYTVSGCATMYKTSLLREIGGFSKFTATEDIDVTWKLQKKLYNIWFQPKAIAYIQVPTSFREYVKQRKRWATGGWHLLRTHTDIFKKRELIKLWPVYIESVVAYIWCFCFVGYLIASLYKKLFLEQGVSITFSWTASLLCLTCIIQMAVSIQINSPYDKNLKKVFFWVPWYPILFFSVGGLLVVFTSIKGIFGSLKDSGKWKSPKRELEVY